MASNIVTVTLRAGCDNCTEPLYQYDYGQILQLLGVTLPEAYEVHFSNTVRGESKTAIGNEDGVVIPDEYLLTGAPVYAWLYLHTGETDGETEFRIIIPVIARAKPTDAEPTPVQQDAITQAIAALNRAVEETAQSADDAAGSATAAETALSGAQAAQAAAEASASVSAVSASASAQSAAQAATSAQAASNSASDAAQSATDASDSADDAEAAQAAAETAQGAAESARNTAQSAAGTATTKAQEASASATAASGSAAQAATSATAAAGSASAASGSATQAATSATAAAGSASDASDSADGAEAAQAAAESARDTITGMSVTASTLPAGSDATAAWDGESGVLSFGIPQGAKGDKGDPSNATHLAAPLDPLSYKAPLFSASTSYSVGDYCMYTVGSGVYLYRFTAAHTGAWTDGDAEQITQLWTLGRNYNTSGNATNSAKWMTTTNPIPVNFYSHLEFTGDTSDGTYALTARVLQYAADGAFIVRSDLSDVDSLDLDANCASIRFIFGRASTASGAPNASAADIDAYFSVGAYITGEVIKNYVDSKIEAADLGLAVSDGLLCVKIETEV